VIAASAPAANDAAFSYAVDAQTRSLASNYVVIAATLSPRLFSFMRGGDHSIEDSHDVSYSVTGFPPAPGTPIRRPR